MKRYNPSVIEPLWQKIWDDTQVYRADLESSKPKYLAMSMFNYPSGAGIHIGHAMNYTISDVKARFKRQQGYESYHPVGWDAFGLPAENFAIKSGVSPQQSMAKIIPGYHKQYKAMGWSNDWSKEIATHEPEYYKWTQWIFSQMYKHGLAYQDSRLQWWCEKDKTVLSNEQVIDGKCWRHDGPDDPLVKQKEVKQWFFKITEYADELLKATDDLDWSDVVKTAQKNWIGKSIGAEVEFVVGEDFDTKDSFKFTPQLAELVQSGKKWATFRYEAKDVQAGDYVKLVTRYSKDEVRGFGIGKIKSVTTMKLKDIPLDYPGHEPFGSKDEQLKRYQNYYDHSVTLESDFYIYEFAKVSDILTVFTTRPDTLYGATFLVLAPEHELVEALTTDEQSEEMNAYVEKAKRLSEVDRQAAKEKTGVFTGSYAINPLNGEKLPVWVADYVLTGYGTGAIMAVPAHDERDYEFAVKFDLPVRQVIAREFGVPLDDAKEVTGVNVIGYDPATKLFMGLMNNNTGQAWLVGGGLEQGESYESAAVRELGEEAGYHDILQWVQVGDFFYSYYYNDNKKSNRRASGYNYLAILDSTQAVHASNEAHENFDIVWQSYDELVAAIEQTGGGNEHWLYALQEAKKAAEAYDDGQRTYVPESYHGDGILINSGAFDGVSTAEARELIVQHLEREGKATEKVNYKMRDWSVSRQRYWGAPIPIVYCEKDGVVLVPDEDLPVILPELDDFAPSGDGRSALARATDWLHTTCPTCGGPAERETDTLDTYICSSWYMFRYMDPHNAEQIFNSELVNKWAPVDFYNGGDHATAHLLYARFVTRFFSKIGLMDNPEPFKQMLFNGKVTASDGQMFSKSKGNGVDPLEIINSGYGADALRTYLMFAAPLELWIRWDPQGVPATHRFLSRVWNLVQEYQESPEDGVLDEAAEKELTRSTHAMIKKITEDLEANRYNTAIAAAMAQTNLLYKLKVDHLAFNDTWKFALTSLIACIAPFAPHVADELWQQLGAGPTVQKDSWPKWDDSQLATDTLTLAVQINGKVRAEIAVATDADKTVIEDTALANERVREFLGGKTPKRVIYVPGRLVNIVV
ncbi:NUDIX domain-containing protein [Candidatus Saccharibacteria bacterium]|nr:MAG: NUDIX domain-containing protein [Candidatus Saccharibacteria bacterium]